MRLGIVADIHEDIEALQRALDEFRSRQVDLVVSLGDACDTFGRAGRAGEVVALLRGAGALGVWGNHDVGLCFDVPERLRREVGDEVLAYMAGMQPQLVVAGCRFSHVEPWLDARRVEDLWYFDGPPDTPEKAARSFAAVSERYLFVGHFHRWLVMTPGGQLAWNGEARLALGQETRYLVIVAPVISGWCAIFDTADTCLIPVKCAVERAAAADWSRE
jgi:predicted phosphodiesterase